MATQVERCEECNAIKGKGHSPRCEKQTPEEWRETALLYYETWLKQQNELRPRLQRLKREVEIWQARHAVVRHENNRLRAKLQRPLQKSLPNPGDCPGNLREVTLQEIGELAAASANRFVEMAAKLNDMA